MRKWGGGRSVGGGAVVEEGEDHNKGVILFGFRIQYSVATVVGWGEDGSYLGGGEGEEIRQHRQGSGG